MAFRSTSSGRRSRQAAKTSQFFDVIRIEAHVRINPERLSKAMLNRSTGNAVASDINLPKTLLLE